MNSLRRLAPFLALGCLWTSLAVPAHADWNGDLNVVLGAKRLDEDPWKPIDSQPSFGLMFDGRQPDWPLNLALDIYHSSDQGTAGGVTRDGSTTEINPGMRKIWRAGGSLRPFVGVGSSFVRASLKDSSAGVPSRSDSDWGAGVWISGGLYWTLARSLNIGFNLKYSSAKVTLLDQRFDAGGRFFGTLIGLSW
jgi:opacity protein-like surface antigen